MVRRVLRRLLIWLTPGEVSRPQAAPPRRVAGCFRHAVRAARAILPRRVELNVEEAWARLAARRIPALLVWGEYDWIMSPRRAGARHRHSERERARTGHTPQILPGVDHGLMSYASMLDAFHDRNPVYRGEPGRAVNDWLRAWSGDTPSTPNVLGDPEARTWGKCARRLPVTHLNDLHAGDRADHQVLR